jgi:NADPH:quinone reductase-like Zn-dependent oxidoreductase
LQLAKLSGAHVTATVGQRNIELVKSLGADEVLDYKTEEGIKLISPSGKKYDVVVNAASGVKWSTMQPHLSPTAQVQDLNPTPSAIANSVFKKITLSKQKRNPLLCVTNEKDLAFMVDLVAQGKIKTFVDSKFPLDKAEDAWAKSIDGHATGKVVVTMVDE